MVADRQITQTLTEKNIGKIGSEICKIEQTADMINTW